MMVNSFRKRLSTVLSVLFLGFSSGYITGLGPMTREGFKKFNNTINEYLELGSRDEKIEFYKRICNNSNTPICLEGNIKKLMNDIAVSAEKKQTSECIAVSSYIRKILALDDIRGDVLLIKNRVNPSNGHTVAVFTRDISLNNKKIVKFYICDLSMAITYFGCRFAGCSEDEAAKKTFEMYTRHYKKIDPETIKKIKDDVKGDWIQFFTSIPLKFFLDNMLDLDICGVPVVLDCDSESLFKYPLSKLLLDNKDVTTEYKEKVGSYIKKLEEDESKKLENARRRRMLDFLQRYFAGISKDNHEK